MSDTVHVRPATPGAVIPWPSLGRPLDPLGEIVARDQFALRRLADGDVVAVAVVGVGGSSTDSSADPAPVKKA